MDERSNWWSRTLTSTVRGTRTVTHRSFRCDYDHETSFLCQPVCIRAAVLRVKSHTHSTHCCRVQLHCSTLLDVQINT